MVDGMIDFDWEMSKVQYQKNPQKIETDIRWKSNQVIYKREPLRNKLLSLFQALRSAVQIYQIYCIAHHTHTERKVESVDYKTFQTFLNHNHRNPVNDFYAELTMNNEQKSYSELNKNVCLRGKTDWFDCFIFYYFNP